ncbi:MAG: PLP-dependent aminotransferase family protein [Prolixibacteraceae bacterium]|nr:PLP-dependent aminotransferase family protein [Prolixibacteraceae bacterium]
MKQTHEQKFSENFKQIPKSFIREILNVAGRENMISFAGGLPNPEFFPVEALSKSASEVFAQYGAEVLQYAGSQGYLPLRKWIANRYSQKFGVEINPANIVITSGSQQTIDVVAKMFVNKGDGVIIEKPSYLGGIQALSAYSPSFLPVNLEPDGPDLLQIEAHCLNHVPKLMYSIPNFQNPSGVCYSQQKREALADLLKTYQLILLEDDPYSEIRFEGADEKPIFSLVPEQVFWSGSFSKMVAPGLRMGWVVMPDNLCAHFVRAKQASDLHSNNLSQYILYHFLSNNSIDEHLQLVREAYKKQRDCMVRALKMYLPQAKYVLPQGGMFIWLQMPVNINTDKLVEQTMKSGVAFVPGKSFFTTNTGENFVRMNFSNACQSEIEKGIKIIADVLTR